MVDAFGSEHHRSLDQQDEFVAWVQSVLLEGEVAVHNGDAGPRPAIWSRNEAVTVLGAWKNARGQAEVDQLFTRLVETFSECPSNEFELFESRCAETPPLRWASSTPPRPSTACRAPTPCE